jgi:hypothetical protein
LSAATDEAVHGALAARLPVPANEEEMALHYLDCFSAAARRAAADGAATGRPALPAGPAPEDMAAPGRISQSRRRKAAPC